MTRSRAAGSASAARGRHPGPGTAGPPPGPRPVAQEGPGAAARDAARSGLYVHVPFCVQRCTYCDFSTGSLSAHGVQRYLRAIAIEIEQRAPQAQGMSFSSVFFGGGTPSALPARAFRELGARLRGAFAIAPDAEITLEANPESVRAETLDAWLAWGVNRLSVGAQSFDADELRLLGRVHGPEQPVRALGLARGAGLERVSVDLMFGYPGHDRSRWERTLDRVRELDLPHVSAYCFIPERGTPLGDAVLDGAAATVAADEQSEYYAVLEARLAEAGLGCYETSNFARPGEEARHNLVYWLMRPYLAVGPSGHGFVNGERYANHHSFSRWATALERGFGATQESEPADARRWTMEAMMLGLRLGTGLCRDDYAGGGWEAIVARYGAAFAAAVRTGRLAVTPTGYRIPAVHRFVADDILAWIESRAESVSVDSAACGSLTWSPCPIPHSQDASPQTIRT